MTCHLKLNVLKEQRDRQVAAKTKEIDAIYHRELDRLKKKYAAQKNYIAAAYIENMQIDSIDSKTEEKMNDESDEQLKTGGLANVYYKQETGKLRNGTKSFAGADHCWRNVPDKFDGSTVIIGSFNTFNKIEFKVKKSGDVYRIIDSKSLQKLQTEGWEPVDKMTRDGNKGEGTIPLSIMKKYYELGEYELSEKSYMGPRLIIDI